MRTVEEWLGKDNVLGINIWKNKYQFENETFEEWLDRVSDGNEDIKDMILNKRFLFGGRILANRGLDKLGKKVTYSNCYVLSVDDSIESIYKTCSDLARTFSYGGGCGLDISKLRPVNSYVNNTARKTSGACSFMDTFSQVTETIGQNGRRGALMLSMDCTHPEIIDFINIKTDLNRVTKANISVRITDDFMKAVKNDEDWELYFKTQHEEIKKIVKAKDIFKLLCKNNWDFAEPGILFWDRIKNYNILSEDENFEYAGVNPCAEEPLPDGGSCLLGALNLSAYVENKEFNFDLFKEDICKAVKGLNEVLDQGLPLHPLAIQRETVRDYRQIGLGVMGIADMLIKMGIKYDSDEALELCDTIGYTLADTALKSSALLAKEYGTYPKYDKHSILSSDFVLNNADSDTYELIIEHGLRNSQLLTIAPTGSISTMIEVSGGIEPIFSFSYTRKTESLHGEDKYYKVYTKIVKEYMEENGLKEEEELPNFFVNAQTINPFKRVEMQGTWQCYIDASISSTVNLPNEATVEDVEQLYMYAWEQGCKGLTIYRDGCARSGVLTLDNKKEEEEEVKELRRGEWKSLADDTYYVKRKLVIGCGTLKLFIGYSPSEQSIQDLYIVKSGQGGCEKNLQAIAIAMSALLRVGGNLGQLEKAFSGITPCPSFVSNRAKGIKLSTGNYCGMAIINEVKAFLKEINSQELPKVKNEEVIIKEEEKLTEDERKFIKENGESAFALRFNKCPQCGEELARTDGCVTCIHGCGWTKC